MTEAAGFPGSATSLFSFPLPCDTQTHTYMKEGVVRDRKETDRSGRTKEPGGWNAHSLETESSQVHLTPQDAHIHAFHLNQLYICRFHLTGIRRTEGANHLSLCPVLLMYVRLISVVVGLLCHSFHFPPHQDHFHISRTSWRGRTLDDGVIHHPYHLAISCSVTGACSSLWPHPTPFLTSTALPPLPQAMAAQASSLGCFKPFFCFFCFVFLQQLRGRGSLSVVVCCMLALSSSSPLCWRVGGGGGGVKPAYASSLQPLSSVNPHCLVILFELTWMLLFGFGACGSFFFLFFFF